MKRSLCRLFLFAFLLLVMPVPTAFPAEGCSLVLVVPQEVRDTAEAAFVFKTWFAKSQSTFTKCDRFITGGTAQDILSIINIHDAKDLVPDLVGARQIKAIRDQRPVTHVLVMKYEANPAEKKVRVQPAMYAIQDDHLEARHDLVQDIQIDLAENGPPFQKSLWRKAWDTVLLKPNALLVGSSTATLINQREQNGDVIEMSHERTSSLPPLVNGISITAIEHANGFDNWDISSRIATSFNLLYFQDSYVYLTNLRHTPDQPNVVVGDRTDYQIKLYGIAVGLNEELMFHTPVGGIFASAGLGLAPYVYNDSLNESFNGISLIARVAGGYRAFVTNRLYAQAAVELMHPMPQFVSNSIFVSSMTSYVFAGIGVFLPGITR